MKKVIFSLIVMMIVFMPSLVKAENQDVTIYMFRSTQCGHCEKAIDYFYNNKEEIPEGVKFLTYQVYNNANNIELLEKIKKDFKFADDELGNVPLFVIGNKFVYGYSGVSDAKKVINMALDAQNDNNYKDIVKEAVKELGIKNESKTLEQIFAKPSSIATTIVFIIFGVIVLGFGAMIVFSRKH